MTAIDEASSKVTLSDEELLALGPVLNDIARTTRTTILTQSTFAQHLHDVQRRYEQGYPTETRNGRRTDAIVNYLMNHGAAPVVAVPFQAVPEQVPAETVLTPPPAPAPVRILDADDDGEDEEHDSYSCELCDCEDCNRAPEYCCGCCEQCDQRHDGIYDNRYRHVNPNDSQYTYCTNCDHWCYEDVTD